MPSKESDYEIEGLPENKAKIIAGLDRTLASIRAHVADRVATTNGLKISEVGQMVDDIIPLDVTAETGLKELTRLLGALEPETPSVQEGMGNAAVLKQQRMNDEARRQLRERSSQLERFDFINASSAGKLVNKDHRTINRWYGKGDILGIKSADKQTSEVLYPVWQFKDGKVLPGLKSIRDALGSNEEAIRFLTRPSKELNNQIPLSLLQNGQVDKVIKFVSKLN